MRQDELQRPKPPWELPPVRKLGPPDWRVLLQGVEEEEDEWGVKGEGERETEDGAEIVGDNDREMESQIVRRHRTAVNFKDGSIHS